MNLTLTRLTLPRCRFYATQRFVLLAVSTMALAACDVHFPISGTLTSGPALPLEGCWIVYASRDRQRAVALTVPHFKHGFATDRIPKTVVIACDGYPPKVVEVPRGGDVGEIVLSRASHPSAESSSRRSDANASDGSDGNDP